MQKLSYKSPIFLLATCFGVGKIPFAPGTWGSLFAVLFFWAFNEYMAIFLIGVIPLLFFGIYISDRYLAKNGLTGDPREIVIDEFVGQTFAILISLMLANSMLSAPHTLSIQMSIGKTVQDPFDYTMLVCLLSFCLFRIFDILKPFPISWVDQNMEGGKGVMYDDALAGVFAGLSSALVFWVV